MAVESLLQRERGGLGGQRERERERERKREQPMQSSLHEEGLL